MSAAEFAGWLGETSVAVSVLILLILLVRRPVAKRWGAEAAYLLWLAPVARIAAPEIRILPPPDETVDALIAVPPMLAEIAIEPRAPFDPWVAAIVFWATGALLFLAWQLLRQARFTHALLRASTPPAPDTASMAADAARASGLRNTPRVRMSSGGHGPLVAGLLRPVIFLPVKFEEAYSLEEQRLALAHECAHIARGDLLATFAALLFRAAQWPNPLAHFAFRAFRADQEAACDAAVIARNAATPDISYVYGAALVKSAAARAAAPAASLAMSHHLKERLMLMKTERRSGTALGRAAAALLVAAGLAATASYSHAAESDAKKEVRVVKKKATASSVSVISVDGDEALEFEGVKDAGKIEVRNENGVRTVKIWDRAGKLVSEKTYAAGEDMPHKTIVIVDAGGKRKTVAIGAEPDHPEWVDEMLDDDGAPGERKIVIMKHGDDVMEGGDIDCEPMVIESGDDASDGERRVTKNIICVKGADSKDPKARAEALKKAIEHMEESAAKEAEHREKMLAKLRAELAAAEKEAAKN